MYSQIFFFKTIKNSIKCEKNITPPPPPNHPHIWDTKSEQGNSVARDLPRTGSETNTTIFVIYRYIGYRFPLSLSTIWGNHLPVNFMFKFPTWISTIWRNHLPHLTSKWRGTFQYFQFHDKMPYIYYVEKPPPI